MIFDLFDIMALQLGMGAFLGKCGRLFEEIRYPTCPHLDQGRAKTAREVSFEWSHRRIFFAHRLKS